jgi:DnaD/phage-associated family protein
MISDDIKCPRNPIQSKPIQSEAEEESDSRPCFDTVEAYAANNLQALSIGNMQEFADFKAELPEELIRHAIDEACAAGKRSWAYTRSILMRYQDAGYKTIGDVKAAEQQRKTAANPNTALDSEVKWWN